MDCCCRTHHCNCFCGAFNPTSQLHSVFDPTGTLETACADATSWMSAQVRKSQFTWWWSSASTMAAGLRRWTMVQANGPDVAAALSVATTTTATATCATAASRDTSTESSELRQCEAAADHRRRREQVFAGDKHNLAELVVGGHKSRVRSGL